MISGIFKNFEYLQDLNVFGRMSNPKNSTYYQFCA